MKKYRLSDETRSVQIGEPGARESVVVRQIIALQDFADVSAGSEVTARFASSFDA